ncbi:MAG: hypothetical protein R3E87_03815 [Burkholderiaceae bacterium]
MARNELFPDLEPPNGDFIAYLETLVGPPPDQHPASMAQSVADSLSQQSLNSVVEAQRAMAVHPGERPVIEADLARAAPGAVTAANDRPRPEAAAGASRVGRQRLPTAARQRPGRDGDSLPDLAGAIGKLANGTLEGFGARLIRGAIRALGSLLLFGGIALVAASILLEDTVRGLTAAPGVFMTIVGIVLRSMAGSRGAVGRPSRPIRKA